MNCGYCSFHFRIYISRTLTCFLCTAADLFKVVYPLTYAIFVF